MASIDGLETSKVLQRTGKDSERVREATSGKPGGKRHNIVQAILAGGTVASIVAISKANGASFGGLADLVVLVWLGVVTLTK